MSQSQKLNRERQFAALGFHYAEGIEQTSMVVVPTTGRLIVRTPDGWETQPWGDNVWVKYDDLIDAARAATPPECRRKIPF
jgi:hypothetical protein